LRRTRKKSKSRGKYLAIALTIMLIVIIAVVVVATTSPTEKPKASKYLSITWLRVYGERLPTTNNSIIVKKLYFNITPVGGDANYILVQYEGSMQDVESIPKDSLAKGEPWYDEIDFSNYVVPVNAEGKVVLENVIMVGCREAEAEEITFEIPLEEIRFSLG